MKKLLITLLLAAGLLTACTTATHTAKKRENTGKAILGISPGKKEITVQAVTADGSPVQVEGCTVTELPSDEETILTATGTKVVLKGNITELDCSSNELTALDVRGLTALQTLYCDNSLVFCALPLPLPIRGHPCAWRCVRKWLRRRFRQ